MVSYYNSPEFRSLKPSVQKERRHIVERFRAEHGDKPVRLLGREHIRSILAAKADTPEASNNLRKCLRLILNIAVDIGMIAVNPVIGIKKYKSRGEGFHTWTEDEILQFEERHPVGSKARLALALMVYTSARKTDATCLGPQHLRNDRDGVRRIYYRQEKTDEGTGIPIHPELSRIIAATPSGHLTFIVTKDNRPYTPNGFGNWFRDRCDEAGLPQCSAHGLRKGCARRLAEAGATHDQIMAFTGHRDVRMVAHYTREANKRKLADAAMATQIGAESEQQLSNLKPGWTKAGAK